MTPPRGAGGGRGSGGGGGGGGAAKKGKKPMSAAAKKAVEAKKVKHAAASVRKADRPGADPHARSNAATTTASPRPGWWRRWQGR